MHNLDQWVAAWRKSMAGETKVGPEILDELENHLRENVQQLVRSGMDESEAFQQALRQLGGAGALASEFQKLEPTGWLPVRLVIGFGALLTLATMTIALVALVTGRLGFLLAGHVFSVVVGYSTTFLIGMLGVCFVGQRCFSELSPARTRSVKRITFILGCTAAGMTAVGILLGMIWAKAEWGRYWGWDVRETGALAVIVWQLAFLFLHRLAGGTVRGILTMSLLGNVIVSLGWFGANMLSGSNDQWSPHYSLMHLVLLLTGVLVNSALFLIGLAPAGWLRLRKTA